MGTLECGAMVMKGYFDVFDRAIGAIEHIESLLTEQDIPIALHPKKDHGNGTETPAHFHDQKSEMQADLSRAKEMVAEACQIAQTVMSEIP